MISDAQIEQAVERIASARHPVSFSGAGLSAESGIATFRDEADDNALWAKFDPVQLASKEGFTADPAMVTDWYNWRRKSVAEAAPNEAHLALARLDGWTHITQNVDNLLEKAGVQDTDVLHLHGSLLEDHCNAPCGYSEKIDMSKSAPLRRCDCGSYMRPSVVWFGESLPEEILNKAQQKAETADLMLVVGTSAQVYPAAGLIRIALSNGAEVIVVNTESLGNNEPGVTELLGPAGEVLPQLFGQI